MTTIEIIKDCIARGWNVSIKPSRGNFDISIIIAEKFDEKEVDKRVDNVDKIENALNECYMKMLKEEFDNN